MKTNIMIVFRWRMQYKMAELRRAYLRWSAEMDMLVEQLQRFCSDVSQRLSLPSFSVAAQQLQHHFAQFSRSARMMLMGM